MRKAIKKIFSHEQIFGIPRNYFYLPVIIFSTCFLAGVFFTFANPSVSQKMLESFLKMHEEALNSDSLAFTFSYIFFNNFWIALAALVSGFFFGIIPVLILISNGFLIGALLALPVLASLEGAIILFVLGILPHGIFELAGFFAACGLGLFLGGKFFARLKNRDYFFPYFRFALKIFFTKITPLLILAAAIETFVTPLLLRWVGLTE